MGPQLKVSSDRLVKLSIKPVTPGLQGKQFIHYTMAAPTSLVMPMGDPRDGFFYPTLTLMIDTYILPISLFSLFRSVLLTVEIL